MRRTLSGLAPTDAFGQETLEHITYDEQVRVEITRPRNLKHHRKFFKLLETVYAHQSLYPTMTSFRGAVEVALGHGETVKLGGGRTIIIPKSISFANMDQAAFEQLYDRAVELITTRILPGLERDDVVREVDDILAGNRAA